MAIGNGIGARLLVGEYNLSGNTLAIPRMQAEAASLDYTTIDKEGVARKLGRRTGAMDFQVAFDDATGATHDAFSGLPTTDVAATYVNGTTRGNATWSTIGKQLNYDWSNPSDGRLVGAVSILSNNYGLQGGRALTAGIENATGAGNLTGYDELGEAGSTDFGAAAYLHVTGFTGTSCTVTIQDSDDNGSGDAYDACGLTFTAVTAATSQRIQTASATENIKRWLRVNLAGTFSSIDLVVTVIRHDTAVAY